MHLRRYCLRNYRRLREVRVELAPDISIFVGSNNSGKTSAAQALKSFIKPSTPPFSLYDFSAPLWKVFDALGEAPREADVDALGPSMSLDLWFEVSETDLHLVLPILPSSEWRGTEVGIRISFEPRDTFELLQRFREARDHAAERAQGLGEDRGRYAPWPSSLTEYLDRELTAEYVFRYYALDRAHFDDALQPHEGYSPELLDHDVGGDKFLASLVRVDFLAAQRHLADPSTARAGSLGRAEDLSKRLSRFYDRNFEKLADDHRVLKALFDSEEGLNTHLREVFAETLQQIATLGYPGLDNPRMEIRSSVNPQAVMSQDARVHYVVGAPGREVMLPDGYNGLGFKNLIYMVVEILDLQEDWRMHDEARAPLHMILIEEPEAHLHAQLQQVFIRKILTLLRIDGDADGLFSSQAVITTHSPHIVYERGFAPIRYFRRRSNEDGQSTQVLNLSEFSAQAELGDRDFLQRYLKLTHCDLFFADAVILVEGNVERILLPLMIEKVAPQLQSVSLSILEVGGAFGHRFRTLVEFLGVTTLLITDLDSVTLMDAAEESDDDAAVEFVIPATGDDEPHKALGSACPVHQAGAVTSNQTLIQWIPGKRTIAELLATTAEEKAQPLPGTGRSQVRVAYQTATEVFANDSRAMLAGRTLEEAFGLENAGWCQEAAQQPLGLRLRTPPAAPDNLAERLHTRVKGKHFDKTKFALAVLASPPDGWIVPQYIHEGLRWLEELVGPEVFHPGERIVEAPSAESPAVEG